MIKHKMKIALWEAQGRACAICDRPMSEPKPGGVEAESPTREHVIPRSAGGGIVLLAHRKCNLAKGNRSPTARELMRIETTLQALEPRALRHLLASTVDRVKQAKERAALAGTSLKEADQALAILLRYVPTADAARALAQLDPDG